MKREGNLATVQAIEKQIKQYGKYKMLRNGGEQQDYVDMGYSGRSNKFSRKYRIFCPKFLVLKGFIDILLVFDYRVNEGRIVIKNELAGLFCKAVPNTGEHLWKLQRYFSCDAKSKAGGDKQ